MVNSKVPFNNIFYILVQKREKFNQLIPIKCIFWPVHFIFTILYNARFSIETALGSLSSGVAVDIAKFSLYSLGFQPSG